MFVFSSLLSDQSGTTAVEYGLIAALIAVAAMTAMGALGNSQSNTFAMVSDRAANASGGGELEPPDFVPPPPE